MTSVFGTEERKFYSALLIPDIYQRNLALEKWVDEMTPKAQEMVRQELQTLVEDITKQSWANSVALTEEKLSKIENDYHLVLEIKLRKIAVDEKFQGILPNPITRFKVGSQNNNQSNDPKSIMSNNEIDLHAMRTTEAKLHVEQFLKDCHAAHEAVVWIIHGKGTGALREEVRRLLTNHRLVLSFKDADQSHGKEGATQVTLKY